MNKSTAFLASVLLTLTGLASATPATASQASQEASGVSAYYRVDLGYKVGWQPPTDRSGVTGYTVTANPGGLTCNAYGSMAKECTFPVRALGYVNQYTFTVSTKKASQVVAVSGASNPVTAASIAYAPRAVLSQVVSSTSVDVAWVPSPNTGGAPLYGYKVTYWKSNTNGYSYHFNKGRRISN